MVVDLGLHDDWAIENPIIENVDKIILHENFTNDTLRDINDIALLKLHLKIKFNDNIQPICLPQESNLKDVNFLEKD